MKRVFLFIFVSLMLGASSVFAQNHFTPGDFNCDANCNLIFSVTLNGDALASSDIEVAAFVGDECRQTARLGDGTENPAYGTMQIPHDGVVTVTFKMYDHNAVAEYDNCLTTITTEEDEEMLGPLEIEFTTAPTTLTQTVAIASGVNWVSFYVETDLEAVEDALEAALPGTNIRITSKDYYAYYNGTRWRGTLTSLDLSQMYMIETTVSGEMTLEGMPADPAEHPVTVQNGVYWIGYPLSVNMDITAAFTGFALSGDKITSKDGYATYNGTRWRGTMTELVPGQGYIYESTSTTSRVLVFPAATSKK